MSIVYVISKSGKPLMPCKPARARHLLEAGEAKVKSMEPFSIQLTIESTEETQPVTVGVDLGAETVGVAAVGNGKVLYQGEVALRTDIHKRMKTRAMYRRSRRSRKCRYRSPRFNNRAASRRKGRLPPSIKSRSDTTVKVVRRIASFLPVSAIVVEIANFDTQAMRAGRRLASWAYQRGELYGFENVKMYVRARDRYTCQYCGEVMPRRLEVDHITPRSKGGSTRPDNLVVACHDCNQEKGNRTAAEFGHPEVQERVKKSLKAAAYTQAGKSATLQGLAEIAPIRETYGYITKVDRQKMGLPKRHYYDAVAIASEGRVVEWLEWYERMKAVSRGARQQRTGKHSHKVARMPYEVFGFRVWDKVELPDGTIGFIGARRKTGSLKIKDIFGDVLRSITYKKLRLLRRATTLVSARELARAS
jgi:5-methylcytosine-specific restriction endonuclease McrA